MKRIALLIAAMFIGLSATLMAQNREFQPSFPGGEEALAAYFLDNLKYPQEAINNSIEGTVTLEFDVNVDGSISNIKIVRPIDPDLEDEAVRVVKSMPKWTPATKDGTPLKSTYRLPVKFRLPKN